VVSSSTSRRSLLRGGAIGDSEPGWSGGTSTLRIRGLDEAGDLIDYIELKR
jgi:hypothetical protein